MHIPWFYYIGRFIIRLGLVTLTSWQVNGKENVPAKGPLLIVSNHLNLIDAPLVSVSIPRQTVFMAKSDLFEAKFTGPFIGSFGAFPVRRNQADTGAVRESIKVLADGKAMVVFPESTRSPNAQMQQAYGGVALIALRSGAVILPVGITGTEKMKGKTWPFRRVGVAVNIGQPFNLPPNSGKGTKEELARLTAFIMEQVAWQLPAEYRGHYLKEGDEGG